MELSDAGLRQQPFRAYGAPLVAVEYSGRSAAVGFLESVLAHPHGLGLFQGPPLSGKTTLIGQFVDALNEDIAYAIIDGAGIEANVLLKDVLRQFGYDLHFDKVTELLNMLKVFALQQAVSNQPPLLIVENTHAMIPPALDALCDLAALKVHQKSALRLILASDHDLKAMVAAPAMSCMAGRVTGTFLLQPLSREETGHYLYEKMRAGGCPAPHTVFPAEICDELHSASGGWPGVIDRLALLAFARAERFPVTTDLIERPASVSDIPALPEGAFPADPVPQPPKLIVSHDGEIVDELILSDGRLLVGRSEHNELRINSRFISRHHALFVRHDDATFLMDLNSTNGTFVNSRRISNLMLKNEDIVQIGNHRIKLVDAMATRRLALNDAGLNETVVMQNLEQVRKLLGDSTKPEAAEG